MLRKLLKCDLKWIYKTIVIFYIIAFIFALLTRILGSIDNSLLCHILASICGIISITIIIVSLINTIIRAYIRFIRNMYKDEAYLTHTLPIERKTIYLSKVLASLISVFTTVIFIILCIFICYYSKENLEIMTNMIKITANNYNTTVLNLLFIISIIIFLEIMFVLLIGYVGIIIGHKSNTQKQVKSIMWGFGLYLGTSLINLLVILIFGLFNNNIMNIIKTSDTIDINAIKSLLYLFIILYLIYDCIYYFIGKKELSLGINID